ncbi:MAG: bifunctional folylpolyglutamate synthase/dihydrofolate synthase [Candidatus Ratteibacteria bacterium]|nr:bifunctional folylpolyglutamate synthase/dihydrofolate synthase [Candidatus Ratteibacteria bacterium]
MAYKQSLNWLYGLEGHGIKLGLSNIRRVLEHFDNPHLAYPVILVAGTNGKGSVASFIAHILREAGLKIGLYTSPHLITIRERISILQGDKKTDISRSALAYFVKKLKEEIKKIFDRPPYSRPTFFEVLTALSFLYFKREKIDAAVYEVGLGGRLDATNVSEPLLSVITSIGLEHTNYLGKTLSSIAKEKGGIIRENTPLVTGAEGEALATLIELAREKNAPIFIYGRDFSVKHYKEDFFRQTLYIKGIKNSYPNVSINLKGKWQHLNASLAVAASEILSQKFPIKKEHIYKGLKKTTWPGRLEVIGTSPRQNCWCGGKPIFILDGAHNPHAAKILKEEIIKLKSTGSNIKMIFGVLKDKDRTEIMKEIFPVADEIILSKPKTERAVPLNVLRKEGKTYNRNITISKNLSETIKKLKKCKNDIILICGSLYLVGEARSILLKKKQE